MVAETTTRAGLEGAARSATVAEVRTAGVSDANDEERNERAVDRRETAIRSNGDQREP